jgi:thiamine-phosphate pyrophosphorylase
LHHHHFLAEEYGIGRLHFPEVLRKEKSDEYFYEKKETGFVLSTSIHDLKERATLLTCFDYCLFGPVFDSISKQGYAGVMVEDFVIPQKQGVKVVAVGGIHEGNLTKALEMGFDGVAVLGSVWNTGNDFVVQYKNLQSVWKQADQLY